MCGSLLARLKGDEMKSTSEVMKLNAQPSRSDEFPDPDGKGTYVYIRAISTPFSRPTLDANLKYVMKFAGRSYILKEEHDAMARERGYQFDKSLKRWKRPLGIKATIPSGSRWVTDVEALDEYRFLRCTLRTFSARKHSLLGRKIKTNFAKRVAENGHPTKRRVYWRADLKKLRKKMDAHADVKPPKGKVRLDKVASELGLSLPNLFYHAQQGKFNSEKYDDWKSDGSFGPAWFVSRKLLEDFAAIDKKHGQRPPVEHLGDRYCYSVEAAKRAGVKWHMLRKYRNKPAPIWGGIVVKAEQIRERLFKSKWDKVWIYRASDLDKVALFITGDVPAVGDTDIRAMLGSLHEKHDEHHRHAVVTGKHVKNIRKDTKATRQRLDTAMEVEPSLFTSTGCEELSTPMSKTEIASRLKLGRRAFETFIKSHPIIPSGNRQLWQIRVDRMDAATRKKVELGK